ncbi:hypothetical protein B0T22DRAFT_441878 [Podospora appendiculata]|uniref:Integral membrane protein n=1 Tax=Podospora appendiculata TaxID=314037 RepID=A0AAE0XDD4_9PEZI|nr:hypothetical protein B0T22DRAFT_441878 [Podospora appendiculata]
MAAKTRGAELVLIVWCSTFAALVAVITRLLARVRARSLGWEDTFIFLALLSKALMLNLIACPFGVMAYSFPNIAIALQMDRVLAPNHLRSIAIRILAMGHCLVAAVSCILLFTQCLPTEHLWNSSTPATCLPTGVLASYCYFVGVITATIKERLVAAVCSVVKTSKFNEMADVQDYTYDTVDLTIWAIVPSVEASVIIIAASAPSIWPLLFPSAHTKTGKQFYRLPATPFTQQFASTGSLVPSAHVPACVLTGNADLEIGELEGGTIGMAITCDFMWNEGLIRALPPLYRRS